MGAKIKAVAAASPPPAFDALPSPSARREARVVMEPDDVVL